MSEPEPEPASLSLSLGCNVSGLRRLRVALSRPALGLSIGGSPSWPELDSEQLNITERQREPGATRGVLSKLIILIKRSLVTIMARRVTTVRLSSGPGL